MTENDLAGTYEFPHPLNHSRVLLKQLVRGTGDDEHLLWWLEIYDANGVQILEAPLARTVHRSMPLGSVRANGPIVYNRLFKLKASFKRQGLARSLYAAENALYKKWGLREIHIDARDDGLVVWMKSFGFLPKLPGALATEYEHWARLKGIDPRPPAHVLDYPEEFLRSRGSYELYKVVQ